MGPGLAVLPARVVEDIQANKYVDFSGLATTSQGQGQTTSSNAGRPGSVGASSRLPTIAQGDTGLGNVAAVLLIIHGSGHEITAREGVRTASVPVFDFQGQPEV